MGVEAFEVQGCPFNNRGLVLYPVYLYVHNFEIWQNYITQEPNFMKQLVWSISLKFVGFVYRIETLHPLLYFKSKFPNHLCVHIWILLLWNNLWSISLKFVGFVYRTETLHLLFYFKRKFSNHFVFTFGYYLFMLLMVQFRNELSSGMKSRKPSSIVELIRVLSLADVVTYVH